MSEKPSILYVNPTQQLRAGIKTLSKTLAENGHDITVLLPEESREEITEHGSVEYVYYDAYYVPGVRYTLPSIDFFRHLRNLVPQVNVVHMYSYFYLPSTTAAVLGNRPGTKVIVTVDSLPGVNWSYGNKFVDLIGNTYTETLGRLTFRCSDMVVALGEYLRRDLRRYTAAEKISVIPNGIDTQRFSPESDRPALTEPIDLLFVGRLDPVKGLSYLLKAFQRLDYNSDYDFRLTIVGDGTNRSKFEDLCLEFGISDRVQFVGWKRDVIPFYRESDILVLPSLAEGQPTVLMEAQACGLPVVATDVGGASSLVATGRVVPPADSAALAKAIADLCRTWSPDIASRARTNITDNYSKQDMCSSYMDLYQDPLS